ncbi:NAD(P)-dependent oxidoreductase [Halobacteriales archaeon QS_1_68_17]|nr:MAG: NAD(P)-dependent oxidoreductase [Halobacteriales archaeon QS_1_68_17]
MTRLHNDLQELAAAGTAVSVAVVGVGRMGRSLVIGAEQIDGVEVAAVGDIRLDRARETLAAAGHDDEEMVTVETVDAGDAAIADGQVVLTEDAMLPPQLAGVDAVIGATGVPDIGAQVAMRSILNEKHVVMLTDETDAAVGPYLSAIAAETGVVYSGAAGDEPGAIMELYDFAASCGFEVVAAGKGKNNPLDRTATPDDLAAEAERKDLNPEIYTAFVDGTNSMLEMTMVANATGLGVDVRGLHGPEVDSVEELSNVFDREADGGLLSRTGVVDYALGGGVAPGVFLVVTTDDETIREDLEYLKMGTGPNYVLHRTYHIPTIEPLLTAARAELYGDANLIPGEPVVDTVAVAKQDLAPGDEIDGIGGHTVYGLAENADVAAEENLVPVSLAEGATVTDRVAQGEAITYDDVELRESDLLHLRKLQDSYF